MAGLSNTGIRGFIASAKFTGSTILKKGKEIPEMVEHFLSGFAGYGWKIWEYVKGKYMLEIDSIRVRGTMTVFELLIQKIRAVKGALGITQGNGKIKTVALSDDSTEFLITLEDEMSFLPGDFIKCQTWTGSGIKHYHVRIDNITDNSIIHILLDEFDWDYDEDGGIVVENAPEVGDEIVQFGNDTDTSRQSAIYIHADENGQPAIDVMFGINSKDWSNCVKIRLGGDIPGTNGLKGFYVENGMIKGTDSTGHVTYCIYPDGTAEFADKAAIFRPDRSGHIAGGAISWVYDESAGKYRCNLNDVILNWNNLSEEVQQEIKPYIGSNGNWWIGDTDTGQKADGDPGPQGEKGEKGADGIQYYTWIKYADTPTTGMSDDPTGKAYIGIAVNKTTATESTNYNDYSWQRTKGDKGDKGDVGDVGKDGLIIIKGEWSIGTQYYNDSNSTAAQRYLSVAMVKDSSMSSGWRAYKCLQTHVSTVGNAPGNTSYWEEFPLNVAAIFTSLIVATNAVLEFTTTNKIVVKNADNSISAVFGGGDYPILVGSDNPETAKFRVFKNGTTESAGVFRGSFGYRNAGNPTPGELRGTQNVYVKYTPPSGGTVSFTLPGGNALFEGTVLNLMIPAHTSDFYLTVNDGVYINGSDTLFQCSVLSTDKFICLQVICFKNENNQYIWEVLNAYSKVRGTIASF